MVRLGRTVGRRTPDSLFARGRPLLMAQILATRVNVFSEYSQQSFEDEFSRYFEIKSDQKIKDSVRTLYLLRGK